MVIPLLSKVIGFGAEILGIKGVGHIWKTRRNLRATHGMISCDVTHIVIAEGDDR